MVQRDQRAELALRIRREHELQCAVLPKIHFASGILLDVGGELRIQREARSSERHQWNHFRALRRGLQHSSRGPGSLLALRLALEDQRARPAPREFPRDRAADDPAPYDDDVVRRHEFILAQVAPSALHPGCAPCAG